MKKRQFKFSEPIKTVEELRQIATIDKRIYSRVFRTSRGEPEAWRITGRVQIWKKNPDMIEFPIAHGLYQHGRVISLTDFNEYFALSYEEI